MLRCLIVVLFAGCIALPLDAQESKGAAPPEINAGMEVVVAPDGSVASVQPDASLPEPVRAGLVKRVSHWHYTVPTWQGRAVSLRIRAGLRLQLLPTTSGGFALRVAGKANVPDPHYVLSPPVYPISENRHKRGAQLVYMLRVDTDGRLSILHRTYPEGPLDPSGKLFDAAARDAIQGWVVRPTLVDGAPIACNKRLPMTFQPQGIELPAKPDTQTTAPDPQRCPEVTLQTKIENTLL